MKKGKNVVNIPFGTLRARIQSMKNKKSEASGSGIDKETQPQIEVIHTPKVHMIEEPSHAEEARGDEEVGQFSTPIRRRGRNRNHALNRQTNDGSKVRIEFDVVVQKPKTNAKMWSRHLGILVRQNWIVPHCTESWKKLSPSVLDNLWQAVLDKFDAENIEAYRVATLKQMKMRWEDWRSKMNIKHVKPFKGNMVKIEASCPDNMLPNDWKWLVKQYYTTAAYQKKSITNSQNKKQLKYPHHTGSMSYPELKQKMQNDAGGREPNFEEFFLETRKKRKDNNSVDLIIQEKYDQMSRLREVNHEISNVDLIEGAFGPQIHGTVLGMGRTSSVILRGPVQTKNELREQNKNLQSQVDKLSQDHQETRALLEDERRKRLEFEKKMLSMFSSSQSQPSLFTPGSSHMATDDADGDDEYQQYCE